MFQGTEGWHVDGNTVELPHTFTIIHCISANKNGPTLLVPLREIVQSLSEEERLDDNTVKTTFNDILGHILRQYHLCLVTTPPLSTLCCTDTRSRMMRLWCWRWASSQVSISSTRVRRRECCQWRRLSWYKVSVQCWQVPFMGRQTSVSAKSSNFKHPYSVVQKFTTGPHGATLVHRPWGCFKK